MLQYGGVETPTNPSICEAMLDAVLFEAGPFEEANKFLWQQMGVEPKKGGKHSKSSILTGFSMK